MKTGTGKRPPVGATGPGHHASGSGHPPSHGSLSFWSLCGRPLSGLVIPSSRGRFPAVGCFFLATPANPSPSKGLLPRAPCQLPTFLSAANSWAGSLRRCQVIREQGRWVGEDDQAGDSGHQGSDNRAAGKEKQSHCERFLP